MSNVSQFPEHAAQAPAASGVCIVCQCEVQPEQPVTACPACTASYHAECWTYNGGCGVYGCSQAATTQGLSSLEIPPSHWGREDKPCPGCGHSILAAAKRCKHCGATFSSAAPQASSAYRQQRHVEASLPAVRNWAIVWLICGLIPPTAPVVAVAGGLWLLANGRAIRALPPAIGAIGKIGVGVAWAQTLLLAAIALLNSTLNG